jgi:3-oxoacyl-[acyl-carrier protein] reductase
MGIQLDNKVAVAEQFGRIDILVNNAGITRDAQFLKVKDGQVVGKMSEEDFDLVVSVNLKGVFNCTQAVAPYLIAAGGGHIVNTSSLVALYGNFGQTNYVATKAGVIGLTRVWARELGKRGITVNAVAPGFIATEMTAAMPEKVIQDMIARIPLGRVGQPEDVANLYLFLASTEGAYLNGAVISVDGGLVIGT